MFENYGVNKITGEVDPESTSLALKFFASDPFVTELNMRLTNKYTRQLMHVFSWFAGKSDREGNVYISQGVRGLHKIASDCLRSERPTTYNAQIELTKPCVNVEDGVVSYKEVTRLDSMEAYVLEMCKGANFMGTTTDDDVVRRRRSRLRSLSNSSAGEDDEEEDELVLSSVETIRRKRLTSDVRSGQRFAYRSFLGQSAYSNNAHDQLRSFMRRYNIKNRNRLLEMPFLHIASQMRSVGAGNAHYLFDEKKTMTYFDCLSDMIEPGVSFAQKVALVTGCGKGSIGSHIVRALLEGGATVVCTLYWSSTLSLYHSFSRTHNNNKHNNNNNRYEQLRVSLCGEGSVLSRNVHEMGWMWLQIVSCTAQRSFRTGYSKYREMDLRNLGFGS